MCETNNLKQCNVCFLNKNQDDFFTYTTKYGREHYYLQCKRCHNRNRMAYYTPKVTGFNKLPDDTKRLLSNLYHNRDKKVKLSKIATQNNLSYCMLTSWLRRKDVVIPTPQEVEEMIETQLQE